MTAPRFHGDMHPNRAIRWQPVPPARRNARANRLASVALACVIGAALAVCFFVGPAPRVPRTPRLQRTRTPCHTPWYAVTPKGLCLIGLVLVLVVAGWMVAEAVAFVQDVRTVIQQERAAR
jgi:hypothetical protein